VRRAEAPTRIRPDILQFPGAQGSPVLAAGSHGIWVLASSTGDGRLGSITSLAPGRSSRDAVRFGFLLNDADQGMGSLWVIADSGACVIYSCGMGGDSPPPTPEFPRENSLTRWVGGVPILRGAVPVTSPAYLDAAFGRVWVDHWADSGSAELLAYDPASDQMAKVLSHRGDPGPLVAADGAVWELAFVPRPVGLGWTLFRVDPSSGSVRSFALPFHREGDPLSLATDGHRLYVASFFTGSVIAIAADGQRIGSKWHLPGRIVDIAADRQSIWAIDNNDVYRLDSTDGAITWKRRVAGPSMYRIYRFGHQTWISTVRGVFKL